MKTIQSIKAYCAYACEENELKGFRPVRRGIKFYKTIAGIRKRLHHQVKRVQPMTKKLLQQILLHVDTSDQKQLVVWSALVMGFHLLLRKSNMVPLKRVHDTVHNVSRQDIKCAEGIMVIYVCWSKTNQMGENVNTNPLVAKKHSTICPVHWLLHMMNKIPALPHHNLFSYYSKQGVVPITCRDLMTYMRTWLDQIGEDAKAYSSHSLRWGAMTAAFNADIPENDIQMMGHWRSQCYKAYIHNDMDRRMVTYFKFNNVQ